MRNLASICDSTRLWAVFISKWNNLSIPEERIGCSRDGALFFQNLVQFGSPPLRSRSPNFQYINRYNSQADCSIWLKFGTDFDHSTRSKSQKSRLHRYVTRISNKNVITHERRGTSNVIWASHLKLITTSATSVGVKLQCIAIATFCFHMDHVCEINRLNWTQ